jgi:hypothetical protein
MATTPHGLEAMAKDNLQFQSYEEPQRLSTILRPLKKKFRLKQIEGLLGEILFALQNPDLKTYDRTTLLLCFDKLLRQYIDLKYRGI